MHLWSIQPPQTILNCYWFQKHWLATICHLIKSELRIALSKPLNFEKKKKEKGLTIGMDGPTTVGFRLIHILPSHPPTRVNWVAPGVNSFLMEPFCFLWNRRILCFMDFYFHRREEYCIPTSCMGKPKCSLSRKIRSFFPRRKCIASYNKKEKKGLHVT